MSNKKSDLALRYNTGKIRYDLVPIELEKGVAKVLTYGANKYTTKDEVGNVVVDGANNWRKGFPWMDVFASAERHMKLFKAGVDYDDESGLLHLEHAATNIAFLLNMYHSHPELDNRIKPKRWKIGLDIDEVLCDWTAGWAKEFGTDARPRNWAFDYDNHVRFSGLPTAELSRIYSELECRVHPDDIPFEPHCYITARSVDPEVTKAWLQKNKFPTKPVYSVGFGQSKVEVAKEAGVDMFLDDNWDHFNDLNEAGITCFLLDAPHNQRYDAGFRRVKSIKEFYEKITGMQ